MTNLFFAHVLIRLQAINFIFQDKLYDAIQRIIERSSKIATTATEHLIKKDFALDPDDNLMQHSASNMARYLAAGMAMNHLANSDFQFADTFEKKLATNFLEKVGDMKHNELCAANAAVLTADNMELFVCYVQKRAAENAISMVSQRLVNEYAIRRRTRADSTLGERQFLQHQHSILQYHLRAMPEQIRLNPGGVKPEQMQVYDEFSANIPGFIASSVNSIDRFR